MKKLIALGIYILIFSTALCKNAYGQLKKIFNLSIDNGLPDNHVYGLTTDNDGYLWLATEKGVIKYNGYECKTFNLSNGLPTDQTWQVYNDKKGRIWLGNLSDEMGYIYKDAYHRVFFNNANRIIYPVEIRATNDGITFFSRNLDDEYSYFICYEHNDSIYKYRMPRFEFGSANRVDNASERFPFAGPKGEWVIISHNSIFKLAFDNKKFTVKTICTVKKPITNLLKNSLKFISGHFLVIQNPVKSNKFFILDLYNGKLFDINIKYWCSPKEEICYIYQKKTIDSEMFFYVCTSHHILQFESDTDARFIRSYNINDLAQKDIDGSKINALFVDSFWGKCLSTNTNGVYIKYDTAAHFKRESDIKLQNYLFVGGKPDNTMFWWNTSTHTLASMKTANKIKYNQYSNEKPINSTGIRSIIPYKQDSFFVMANGNISPFWLTGTKMKFKQVNHVGRSVYSAVFDDSNYFYFIGISQFCKSPIGVKNSIIEVIDNDKYSDLLYNRVTKTYWAYNNLKITTYNRTDGKAVYSQERLMKFGVNSINKLLIDSTYGNVFIKGNEIISLYDPLTKTHKPLFNDLYLKESDIFIYHDMLVIIGKFGILFSKVTGPGQVSAPIIYYNRKNIFYKRIYDVQLSWNKALFKTDKGIYSVEIPSGGNMTDIQPDSTGCRYKFLVYYKNNIISPKQGDTIVITQNQPQLRFDIVNPFGNGPVKYLYIVSSGDSAWHELNSNELVIPSLLLPDEYHRISLLAHDDVWKSKRIDMYLYIQPYWWQKLYYSWFFAPGIIIAILTLIALIVFMTRRIVVQHNIKKNLQLELELKSVHSQINPHFISNSLSAVMYLIKTGKLDGAYHHLSNFSHLLRSYIKSSRNLYTSLNEEVDNLRTYIEMQQIRFNNKFEYLFVIDDDISGSTKIPSLLLQPLVENAIIHGLLEKETLGHLKIDIKKINYDFVCIIEDDGIGRERSRQLKERTTAKKESYGNDLIKDLVRIFNQYEKVDIRIDYKDKVYPDTGTIVYIIIKNHTNG